MPAATHCETMARLAAASGYPAIPRSFTNAVAGASCARSADRMDELIAWIASVVSAVSSSGFLAPAAGRSSNVIATLRVPGPLASAAAALADNDTADDTAATSPPI